RRRQGELVLAMLGHDGTAGRGLPAGPIYCMPPRVAVVGAPARPVLAATGADPRAPAPRLVPPPPPPAVRRLREAPPRAAAGRPLLLPRMVPLGDIDPEELLLTADETGEPFAADLPPAITPPRRQMLLAAAIAKGPHRGARLDQALRLAEALGRFLDQVQMERLNLADLARLVPDDHALHWRQTLDFLTILSEVWPEIRAAAAGIDPLPPPFPLIPPQPQPCRRPPP